MHKSLSLDIKKGGSGSIADMSVFEVSMSCELLHLELINTNSAVFESNF